MTLKSQECRVQTASISDLHEELERGKKGEGLHEDCVENHENMG